MDIIEWSKMLKREDCECIEETENTVTFKFIKSGEVEDKDKMGEKFK